MILQNGTADQLLKMEWQKEQYVKKALYEENLDEKEFPVDQALQLIEFAGKTRISPMRPFRLRTTGRKKCTGSTNITNGKSGKNGNLILMTWPKAVMNCFKAGLIFSHSTKTDFLIF